MGSPLRRELEAAVAEAKARGEKAALNDFTVLATQNDPYRLDTPAYHRDGAWLAEAMDDLIGNRALHLRGIHYIVLGRTRPDGSMYVNTDECWWWISNVAAKAARWLGYVPFDQITDARNNEPTVRLWSAPEPEGLILPPGLRLPGLEQVLPCAAVDDFTGEQPYKLVLLGEKSSLDAVLGPIADTHQADLYLPTGECSDTLIAQMARVGADDGRPMRVLYFADCDPAGWQMAVSVSRKLQALRTLQHPGLDFTVERVALTPAQVQSYGLPGTPLKDTEKRASRWREASGVEQTEIDSLASLRPELLTELASEALAPYFDHDLAGRVQWARMAWIDEAQERIDAAISGTVAGPMYAEVKVALESTASRVAELASVLAADAEHVELPEIEVPEAEVRDFYGEHPGRPLLSSAWPFEEQSKALIDSKQYRDLADDGDTEDDE